MKQLESRWRLSVFVLFLTGLAWCDPPSLHAAGSETTIRGDDVVINVDTRWAGTTDGGYYPIRLQVLNQGDARQLDFEFRSVRPDIPIVRLRVEAEPGATFTRTLQVPMVGDGASGRLTVSERGTAIDGLECDLGLTRPNPNDFDRPALLVISDVQLACDQFEDAVAAQSVSSMGHHFGPLGTDSVVIPPASLPENWIDYTGLDWVAIGIKTLVDLPPQDQRAIISWMETGGTLLVFDLGEPLDRHPQLRDVLQLDQRRMIEAPRFADPQSRLQLGPMLQAMLSRANAMPGFGRRQRGVQSQITPEPAGDLAFAQGEWQGDPAFAIQQVMLGRLVMVSDNPFPGSTLDWFWLLSSVGPQGNTWTNRYGMSARASHDEFLEFLIPGVRGVPIFSFLTLITLFTIVIGPVNYFLLWRRKQLFLLILTIPFVAFLTSVGMFAYSFLAHGFAVKSRVRAVTVIDQGSQDAVTVTRAALHAGLAPSAGLQFDRDTAVFPIWPKDTAFEGGVVDWTDRQNLQSGWLRSRTRTQLLTVSHESIRGGLEVSVDEDGSLSVANGLEWNLAQLVVRDRDGRTYFTDALAAGEQRGLQPATDSDLAALGLVLAEFRPEPPDGFEEAGERRLPSFGRRSRRRQSSPKFDTGLLELQYRSVANLASTPDALPQGSYAALVVSPDAAPVGVEGTEAEASTHLLIGRLN